MVITRSRLEAVTEDHLGGRSGHQIIVWADQPTRFLVFSVLGGLLSLGLISAGLLFLAAALATRPSKKNASPYESDQQIGH
jgi:hypothetical protein